MHIHIVFIHIHVFEAISIAADHRQSHSGGDAPAELSAAGSVPGRADIAPREVAGSGMAAEPKRLDGILRPAGGAHGAAALCVFDSSAGGVPLAPALGGGDSGWCCTHELQRLSDCHAGAVPSCHGTGRGTASSSGSEKELGSPFELAGLKVFCDVCCDLPSH